MKIRRLLGAVSAWAALATASLLTSTAPAVAQDFPNKPITLLVAWPAGGGHDTVGRLVAEYMGKYLSQPVVVQNQPGAAGVTGVRQASLAAADGYTIGVMGLHVIAQSFMNENAAPLSALDPLSLVEKSPAALSVRADTGVEDLQGFIAKAKEDPSFIINANDGPGGFASLSALLMQKAIGTEFSVIPYQGYAPAVAAIVSGEANSSTVPTAQMLPSVRGGEVRFLGIASEQRHPGTPDTPTFTESGVPFAFHDFVGLFLPQGVPIEVRATLAEAADKAVKDPDFLGAANKAGLIIAGEDGAAFSAFIQAQADTVYPVLDASGLVKVKK